MNAPARIINAAPLSLSPTEAEIARRHQFTILAYRAQCGVPMLTCSREYEDAMAAIYALEAAYQETDNG